MGGVFELRPAIKEMEHKHIAAFICLILCAAALASCNRREREEYGYYSASSLEYFDTVTAVSGYCESEDAFNERNGSIMELLSEYHRLYDIYFEYSGINNLKTVNDMAGIAPVQVDDRIIDLLEYSKEVYALTGGKTNIAMGSVLSLWHSAREYGIENPEEAYLPEDAALRAAAEHTDIDCLIIDREKKTVYLSDPEMSLDVGAVAKGYAAEEVADYCEKHGFYHMAVSIGGNVRTVGSKPGGEDWTVGVQDPFMREDFPYFCRIQMSGMSLVTSGSYQRYYTVNGEKYHHIIDPDTLYPGNGFVSVSVLCRSSAMGDALSTALFNMSAADGMELVNSLDGVEALWIYPDMTSVTSSGFAVCQYG